jgi:Acyl-CoA reductase (LuxC)
VSLSPGDRRARVGAVLEAARRLADRRDPLGREAREKLPEATGLSSRGVDLGLVKHLETSVSAHDLDLLVQRAGDAPHVHVVLSAHVFVGAVRALALAVAAAPRVSVRPSRRESVVAPLVASALAEGPFPVRVEVVSSIDPRPGDEVHVYGRRESIDAVRAACDPAVHVRGHGPGVGVAVVEAGADFSEAARELSWDIVAFDQRGCLSPRIALVSGTPDEVERWTRLLSEELARREQEIPRGFLSDDERAQAALYRDTMAAVGRLYEVPGASVGVDLSPRTLLLPPSGRHLHVASVRTEEQVGRLLAPLFPAVTTVGIAGDGPVARAASALATLARRAPLGRMQMPPLDGPVDLRDLVGV